MRQAIVIAMMIGAAMVLSALRNAGASSPDLLATWMAGLNFSRGDLGAIYPEATGLFTMHPPESWIAELRAAGHDGAIYPFIYPPLWAWAGGILSGLTDYGTVVALANVLNPVLLGLTLWLAARVVADGLSPLAHVAVGLAMFAGTAIAVVALEQNQPQILVAFLTLLAVERVRAGAPVIGGASLALAAAIKVYPALFALFWLARGERRAAASFALAGGGLGLFSIWIAGWPLHAAFLAQMSDISGTVLVTAFTHSVDPVIAQTFFGDAMTVVPGLDLAQGRGWQVMAKPALWRAADAGLLLAVLAALVALARSRHGADPLFWPLAFTAIALVSPLSWGYHYLAAVAFLPALLSRLGPGPGLIVLMALIWPTSVHYVLSDLPILAYEDWAVPLGSLAMALYAGLLLAIVAGVLPRRARGLAPA